MDPVSLGIDLGSPEWPDVEEEASTGRAPWVIPAARVVFIDDKHGVATMMFYLHT